MLFRSDQTFERIWRAIEDGSAPPGGRERVEALTARREDVERRLADARAAESYRLDRDAVEYWLENMAADLDRQTICETFVKRVVIVGGDLHILLIVDDDVGPSRGGEVLGLFDQANVIPTSDFTGAGTRRLFFAPETARPPASRREAVGEGLAAPVGRARLWGALDGSGEIGRASCRERVFGGV